MKIVLFVLLMAISASGATFDDFCVALGKAESSSNPKAYNSKERAIGLYQIRPAYFKDAQQFDRGLDGFKHSDCYNPQVAKRVVWAYFSRYEYTAMSKGDAETMARLHNSGPNWRNKLPSTNNYWTKIKIALTK